MTTDYPENWTLFFDLYPLMMKFMRKVGSEAWFIDGGYATFIGYYHAGAYAQVYKTTWYNQTLDGVHFEVGVSANALAAREVTIDLHIGHRNVFDRARFNELTVAALEAAVADWSEPVRFSRTNLSERLSMTIKLTRSGLADQLAAGFGRIAQLGPIIDAGLAKL